MPNSMLNRLALMLSVIITLVFLSATAFGQADPPEHGAEGSYTPTRNERTRADDVRTPQDNAKFVNSQVKKFARAGARAKIMSLANVDAQASESSALDPSSWTNTYGELVRRYGERGQVLYLNEYLKALYTTKYNGLGVTDKTIDVTTLIDGKLLKGKSYEQTLREQYQVPAEIAGTAVKWAKDRVKAISNAVR